jgi:hypothetical protein
MRAIPWQERQDALACTIVRDRTTLPTMPTIGATETLPFGPDRSNLRGAQYMCAQWHADETAWPRGWPADANRLRSASTRCSTQCSASSSFGACRHLSSTHTRIL